MTFSKLPALFLAAIIFPLSSFADEPRNEVKFLELGSIARVSNNPPNRTTFKIDRPALVSKILTYHWNEGRGAKPGTLGLRNIGTGAIIGSWPAIASKNGFDLTPGAKWPVESTPPPYLYWATQPNVELAPGEYEVVDSDRATWAYTADTGNRGIAFVLGYWNGSGGGLSRGPSTPLLTADIGTGGISVPVSAPGHPLNGMKFAVPPGSFPQPERFKISSAPIFSHSFGSEVKPVSPLITVENSGRTANDIITVQIPLKIDPNQFVMAFYYNETTKKLEGIPTASQDANSITIAVRHFSSFFLSAIDKQLLNTDIDTQFRPGIDDWQFVNHGSFIAPGGHCTGQSMTAMWYFYEQPDGRDLTLFGRYDNNGRTSTPALWQDDSLSYRFASVVWKEMDWSALGRKITEKILAKDPLDTWRLFAYSMKVTRQPQMTEIWDTVHGGGHAMIVYRIKNGSLYIADPNYPGNTERRIEFKNGAFVAYNSANNRKDIDEGRFTLYDKITYVAKDSLSDWSSIRRHWDEMKKGTIGNDKFPVYQLHAAEEGGAWGEWKDGLVVHKNKLRVSVTNPGGLVMALQPLGELGQPDPRFNPNSYELTLTPGANTFGLTVLGRTAPDRWGYVDFRYITVNYSPEAAPGSIEGIWNPCSRMPGLCNQYNFSGGNGLWIHGGFRESDSMKTPFRYEFKEGALHIYGALEFDIGDQSPFKVSFSGDTMTWQSINSPTSPPIKFQR